MMISAAAGLACGVVAACKPSDGLPQPGVEAPPVDMSATEPALETDLIDVAGASGEFTTLLSAAQAAGMADFLKGPGPYTLLAPTDAAFAALPEGQLADLLRPENKTKLETLLRRHVIAGEMKAQALMPMTSVTTLAGDTLPVDGASGVLVVGGAKLVRPDIDASNGVVHAIDKVLIPTA